MQNPQYRGHSHKTQSVSNKTRGIDRVSLTPVHNVKQNEKRRWCDITEPSHVNISLDYQSVFPTLAEKVVNPAKHREQDVTQAGYIFNCN